MRWLRTSRRIWALVFAGLAAGGLAGAATVALATSATAQGSGGLGAVFEVTHTPPLLTVPGEPLVLGYEPHCLAAGVDDPELACHVEGTLSVRTAGDATYREIPLAPRDSGGLRRLEAVVPVTSRTRAIEYYARFRSPDVETRLTVPPGGASAPHVSRVLVNAVRIDLGEHAFGSSRMSGERTAYAPWGHRGDEVGLESGRTLDPIGASAFDVDQAGSIAILDQVNRRLLRWTRHATRPSVVPLSVNGSIADLALAGDGSLYVLETTSRDGRAPLVRRFDDTGRELEAVEAAERGPAQIRMGPGGPLVLQRPSHQWMPAAISGLPATPAMQRRAGRVGRTLRSGVEIVLLRYADEIRVALIAGGAITRSWRISSATQLGEVQLAEPLGQRLLIVARVYDDRVDEYVVLVLDRHGLVSRATLAPADWAETAPLGRFRLVGRTLYRLGSSPAGAFVDRFDLEVR